MTRDDPDGTTSVEVESNGQEQDFYELFRLDSDSRKIESQILEMAPEMAPFLASFEGLRLMRPSCAVESFFSFLCTPNNNLTRIVGMVRQLATYGPLLDEQDGHLIHRFPLVEQIASIPEAELRAKAFGYRAATIPAVAAQVLGKGENWIEGLKTVPYRQAHEELCSLKGIGPKLADCIALFALHHTEAAPIDTHIWQAATRLYFPEWRGMPLTDTRYRLVSAHLSDRFGPLAGWAQQYLFYDNMLHWRERQTRT